MNLSVLATKAVNWLTIALRFAQRRVVKVKRYLRDLIELEQTDGADTNLWVVLKHIEETGQPEMVSVANAKYGNRFKALWDKYFKKPLRKLAELLAPAADELFDDDDDN